jgi:phosphatidylserine decarboxylase
MPSNSYPIIAKEGWPLLVLLIIFFVVAYYYLYYTITVIDAIFLLVFVFLLRDPARIVPSFPLAIVSPVHGSVFSVEEVDDPWVERRAISIRIKMKLVDIYSLRSPTEGKVINQWTRRPDNSGPKRQFAFRIRSDEGDEIVVIIHLNIFNSFLFRFYVHSGERLGQGQRCGFLYFGGIIDVIVPLNSKIKVNTGDRISAGSGIIAQLVHTDPASVLPAEATPSA